MGKFIASILLSFLLICATKNLQASIVNNVEDPCISKLVSISISESITNEISTLIRKFYDVSDSINLTIDQVYDLDNSLDAITTGYYNLYGELEINISFNGNTMVMASHEYILATLYHEFLHAILLYNDVENGQQHEPIAIGYREILAHALLQHFPGLSEADASILTWAGLQETEVWNNLKISELELINVMNKAYKTGKKGTKCN